MVPNLSLLEPSNPTASSEYIWFIGKNSRFHGAINYFLFCSKVHRALITSPKILELVGNNLTVGQRVFLSGELRATNFMTNENQNRQMFQVRVNELYASKLNDTDVGSNESESSESKKSIDHNSVFILAHIASDIQHYDNHSRFFVASHFTTR